MIRILANDGIGSDGKLLLEEAGCEVITQGIPQDKLISELQKFEVILVRSATKVRKDLIDACPNLKIIGRGGVGLDNIDVEYARSKGILVINTPAASSRSVAELVFGHFFSLSRFLHLSNREMPVQGATQFNLLKKNYAKGVELKGQTIGIIGLGRIGLEVAKIALGLGMKVLAVDPFIEKTTVKMEFPGYPGVHIDLDIVPVSKDKMLANADYISLHVPMLDKPVISAEDIAKLKKGVILVNASRGGMIEEEAILNALESGHVKGIGLDVFRNEPTPDAKFLNHPQISVTPHIGAATSAAQQNIGLELAKKLLLISSYKQSKFQ